MRRRKISEEELDKMISDAVVDCYDEEEEFMGILYTVEAGMSFPFKAKALGETVEVTGIDDSLSSRGRGVIATVRKQGREYNMGLAELEIEPDDAENAKWLEMYHYWLERYLIQDPWLWERSRDRDYPRVRGGAGALSPYPEQGRARHASPLRAFVYTILVSSGILPTISNRTLTAKGH